MPGGVANHKKQVGSDFLYSPELGKCWEILLGAYYTHGVITMQ